MTQIEFYFDVGSDLLVALAAVGTVFIAWKGLNTWEKQLKGKAEYDLARRLLVSTYKFREKIRELRRSFVSISLPTEEEMQGLSRRKVEFIAYQKHYNDLWNSLVGISNAIEADLLESEAILHCDVINRCRDLMRHANTLRFAIDEFLEIRNPDIDEEDRELADDNPEKDKERRAIMYEKLSNDTYGDKLQELICAVEAELKQFVQKK